MVKRVSALLELSQGEPVSAVSQKLDASRTSIYEWLKTYLVEGEEGLNPEWKGGRPSGLTGSQKKQLTDMVKAGPAAAGFVAGGWNSVMIQELIWREFGVLYNVHYVCELLKNLGFSFQKARFISDHLDEAKRLAWMTLVWPTIYAQARQAGGCILFGDEASFAQWGLWATPGLPKGSSPPFEPPASAVPTRSSV